MRRLVWNRERGGWRSGSYRIELIAPRMWALVVESGQPGVVSRVVTTSASLRCIKREAERREWRRWRNRRVYKYSMGMVAALGGLALLPALSAAWMVVASVATVLLALRSLAVVTDMLTNSSWARVSQTYQ